MEILNQTSYDEILSVLTDGGIDKNKTTDAQDTHKVPASGEIIGYSIQSAGEPTAHVCLHFKGGDKCSVSRFRGQAHFDGEMGITEGKKDPDTIFLKTTVLNTHLPADQARLVAECMNKKFTAKKVIGRVVPFGKNFTKGQNEDLFKATVAKDFWKITLT